MKNDTVSFEIDPEKKAFLDELAKTMDRDRSGLINEALDQFIEVRKEQIAHTREGMAQARRGEFVPQEEVDALRTRWRK